MPPFRGWPELPPELLCRIGDSLDLKCYSSARGACTAWRCALAPPSPSLLVVPDDRCCPSAASLLTPRSFELKPFPAWARCVGSSNGWLALSTCVYDGHSFFSLFNPVTATKIVLPPLIHESRLVSKLVFAPNPARDDFAVAAICDLDRLAYVTAGASRWAILGPVRLAPGDHLADVVYHEKEGKVYCLTAYGDVHVLSLSERRREPVMVDDPSSLSSPAQPPLAASWTKQHHAALLEMPHENAPASLEPLLSLPTNFAWPYSKISGFTSAKNLVFCEGNMYQIWRNTSCTVTLKQPGGGHRRIGEDEVFVLRYYPGRQPCCWVAVTDLGGYSVFLGRNNAVSMYAEAVPGFKGNCVYWISRRGRDQGMIFDMTTGRSTPCLPAADGGARESTVCWYFLSDMVNNRNSIN